MKPVFLFLATTLSFNLLAQPLMAATAERAEVVNALLKNTRAIQEEAKVSSATTKDLQEALKLVRQAKRIVLDLSTGGSDDVFESPSLKCISLDNDGRAPYVYAYLSDDFKQTKLTSVKFMSVEQCQKSLAEARSLANSKMLCVSADGDDRRPWILTKLEDNTLTKSKAVQFTSYGGCSQALSDSGSANGKLAFCTSKDGDDIAPYVIGLVDKRTGDVSRSSGQYGSMAECQNLLSL